MLRLVRSCHSPFFPSLSLHLVPPRDKWPCPIHPLALVLREGLINSDARLVPRPPNPISLSRVRTGILHSHQFRMFLLQFFFYEKNISISPNFPISMIVDSIRQDSAFQFGEHPSKFRKDDDFKISFFIRSSFLRRFKGTTNQRVIREASYYDITSSFSRFSPVSRRAVLYR